MNVFVQRLEPPVAHLVVSGREYMLMGSGPQTVRGRPVGWVTVVCDRWCHDRRALGKTFHHLADLIAHYKQHGAILGEYAQRLVPAWATAPTPE